MQWLVAKAFNQAVRACCHRRANPDQDDDDDDKAGEARRWAHVALELAPFCGDAGATEALLYEQMGALKLNLG